jgi:hypothetical protein
MAVVFSSTGLKPSISADKELGVAGEAISAGDVVYRAAATGLWWLSDANGTDAAKVVNGMVVNAAAAGQTVLVVKKDPLLTTGATSTVVIAPGDVLVLDTTPGKLQLAPADAGGVTVVVGVALSATSINLSIVAGGAVA